MWKPEQLLEGKDFDPVFAHAIVRKYPELDDILWDACYVDTDEIRYIGAPTVYTHKLRLDYRNEEVAILWGVTSPEESFYKFIMGS